MFVGADDPAALFPSSGGGILARRLGVLLGAAACLERGEGGALPGKPLFYQVVNPLALIRERIAPPTEVPQGFRDSLRGGLGKDRAVIL